MVYIYGYEQLLISNQTKQKNKTKPVLTGIIVLLVLAAAAYFVTAYLKKDLWPFSQTIVEPTPAPSVAAPSSNSTTKSASLITKASVDSKEGVMVLNVKIKASKQEKGTCTLDLSSKSTSLTLALEDSTKSEKDMVGCTGWSVDVSKLPKAVYIANVTFNGEPVKKSDTAKVIIELNYYFDQNLV